ncbi:MAG TPA: hypothetical protein VG841_15625 [Caulobacterales bacterium]|nr:hypothetical protein [Caulobacterales bacterium]
MDESVKLTPEQEKARKQRNLLIGLSVAAFVALVFLITLSKLANGGIAP